MQRLQFCVHVDDDGDWSDETALLDTTAIDDVWSAGKAGVYSAPGGNVAEFDDFRVGYDNNADLDIDDGGDDVQVDETFNSNAATLAYDDNGNLTDDGVYKFAYDAWNRMVQVKRRPDAATTIATYAYDAVNRRQSKVVTNCGIENSAGDGGDTTVHFYDGSATGLGSVGVLAGGVGGIGVLAGPSVPWNIFETRNGDLTGLQARTPIPQWVRGTQYIDEVLFMDVNGDPSADNDADIDVTAGGESGESPADKRYFYHQDRNWNVVALTEYSPPGSPSNVSGRVAERYVYTPYGEFVVLTGDGGGGELAACTRVSATNSDVRAFGAPTDSSPQAQLLRNRWLHEGRFATRDPSGYADGMNLYGPLTANPITQTDPDGLFVCINSYRCTLSASAPVFWYRGLMECFYGCIWSGSVSGTTPCCTCPGPGIAGFPAWTRSVSRYHLPRWIWVGPNRFFLPVSRACPPTAILYHSQDCFTGFPLGDLLAW